MGETASTGIIKGRVGSWCELGTFGVSAYEVVDQAIVLSDGNMDDIAVVGKLAEIADSEMMFLGGREQGRYALEKKVIWELGNTTEGREVLVFLANGYLAVTRLGGVSISELNENDSLYRSANLAMVRLAELNEIGDVKDDVIEDIRDNSIELLQDLESVFPYLRYCDRQFGLTHIWERCLRFADNQNSGVLVSEVLGRYAHCNNNLKASFIDPIFCAAEKIGANLGDRSSQINYFENRGDSSLYNKLSRQTFIAICQRKMDKGIFFDYLPADVNTLFAQNDGLLREILSLAWERGMDLPWLVDFLYRSVSSVKEDEFISCLNGFDQSFQDRSEPLVFGDLCGALSVWSTLSSNGDRLRFLRIFDVVIPDYLAVIGGGIGLDFNYGETFKSLCLMRQLAVSSGVEMGNECLFPIMCQEVLNIVNGGRAGIAFIGVLAAELQRDMLRAVGGDDQGKVLRLVEDIKQNLHCSNVAGARDLVNGLYLVWEGEDTSYRGVTKEDLDRFEALTPCKPTLDIIRRSVSMDGDEDMRRVSLNMGRIFCQTLTGSSRSEYIKQYNLLEQILSGHDREKLGEAVGVMYEQKKHPDFWCLYPAVLAVRRELLREGVSDNLSEGDIKIALQVAEMSGDLSYEANFVWRRKKIPLPNRLNQVRQMCQNKFVTSLEKVRRSLSKRYTGDESRVGKD